MGQPTLPLCRHWFDRCGWGAHACPFLAVWRGRLLGMATVYGRWRLLGAPDLADPASLAPARVRQFAHELRATQARERHERLTRPLQT